MKIYLNKVNVSIIIAVIILIFLWLFFPAIFNWWAVNVWKVPLAQVNELNKLGPLGDIYGSLNTLISSIALMAVAYSTYLQISSLREARQVNAKQLELAHKSHTEQLIESKHAIFSNTFNSLLNHKQDRYNGLFIRNKETGDEFVSEEIFVDVALRFLYLLENNWNSRDLHDWDRTNVGKLFDDHLSNLGGINRGAAELRSYFCVYGDLINLIQNSSLSETDKDIYRKIVSNSMSVHEQFALLWISINTKSCSELVVGSRIFNHFYNENMMPFLKKFFVKSCFSHSDILNNWDKF